MNSLRWRVFIASWLSYAGFYCTRKAFSVVKGPIKTALSTDDLGVAYLYTLYLVAYMLGQFLSAALSRRLSNRRLLLIGMSTSVACNLAIGALLALQPPGAYAGVAVAMTIQGFAQATGWPCNVGLMAAWTRSDERGRVLAVWGTCYQVGSVASKLLASFMFGALGLAFAFWAARSRSPSSRCSSTSTRTILRRRRSSRRSSPKRPRQSPPTTTAPPATA